VVQEITRDESLKIEGKLKFGEKIDKKLKIIKRHLVPKMKNFPKFTKIKKKQTKRTFSSWL